MVEDIVLSNNMGYDERESDILISLQVSTLFHTSSRHIFINVHVIEKAWKDSQVMFVHHIIYFVFLIMYFSMKNLVCSASVYCYRDDA